MTKKHLPPPFAPIFRQTVQAKPVGAVSTRTPSPSATRLTAHPALAAAQMPPPRSAVVPAGAMPRLPAQPPPKLPAGRMHTPSPSIQPKVLYNSPPPSKPVAPTPKPVPRPPASNVPKPPHRPRSLQMMMPTPLRQIGFNCYLYAGLLSSESQGQPFTVDLANTTVVDVMALGKSGGFTTGGAMSSVYKKIDKSGVITRLGQGAIIVFSPTDEQHAYGVTPGTAPGTVIHLDPKTGRLTGDDVDPLTQNGLYYEASKPALTSVAYSGIVRNFLTTVRVPYMEDQDERRRQLRDRIKANIGLLDSATPGLTVVERKHVDILRRCAPK